MLSKIKIKREIYPEIQRPEDQKRKSAFCMYPIYTSRDGITLLETRNSNEIWRSEDNGSTWMMQERMPSEEILSNGNYAQWLFGPFFYDSSNDHLIQFLRKICYRCPLSEIESYYDSVKMIIQNSSETFYRISFDGGISWDEKRRLIEDGYNEHEYAKGYKYGENTLYVGEVPPYLVLNNGSLMLPFQGQTKLESEEFGTFQAGRMFGVWDNKLKDYRWKRGGIVPGGGCEQTIVRLQNDNLLNVLRIQGEIEPYYFDIRYRPYSVSKDDGKSWSVPKPLCWDDGEHIVTPRAWSQLIRAHNGRLYWIANILPDINRIDKESLTLLNETWRSDPRYPLIIAEVDEEKLMLKRSTSTVIIDREEDEPKLLRYSNFFCYNDRITGEIVMYMMKSYHQDQPDLDNVSHTSWRFRIKV